MGKRSTKRDRKLLSSAQAAKIFFIKRFGKRRYEQEIKTGYFDTWLSRFRRGTVEKFADSQSMKVIRNMRKRYRF